jgi:hypothetical protein
VTVVDNQHRKITGYRDAPDGDIQMVNRIKAMEISVAALRAEVRSMYGASHVLGRAADQLSLGFSDMVRAVMKPQDPFNID